MTKKKRHPLITPKNKKHKKTKTTEREKTFLPVLAIDPERDCHTQQKPLFVSRPDKYG